MPCEPEAHRLSIQRTSLGHKSMRRVGASSSTEVRNGVDGGGDDAGDGDACVVVTLVAVSLLLWREGGNSRMVGAQQQV